MSLPNAFITLLTTPSYLPGALVLLHSLIELHPAPRDFKLVCLVTPETVDAKTIGQLRKAGFDLVIGVEPIGSGVPGQDALHLLGRPDLNLALTKLHLFRLGPLFSTLIYLDADVLPLRPLSHLFTSTAPHVLSACPDTGWPDCFNSGVMVIRPRESDWTGMRALLKDGEGEQGVYQTGSGNGSFDGADQGLLNEWFSEEGGGGPWNRLSFTYNVTPTAAYTYAPAYKRYGHKINAVHFIGSNKPWSNLQGRPAGFSSTSSKELSFNYPDLIDRWYAVYDKYVRPTAAHAPDLAQRFAVPETVAVWNQSGISAGVPQQPSDRLDLEGLKDAASRGVSAFKSGQYTSLPLDGRVDLIMPKPKAKRVSFLDAPSQPVSSSSIPTSTIPMESAPSGTEPSALSSPPQTAAPPPQTVEQQTTQPSTWDASREPPPANAGPEMAIPMNTFYQPAWEQPRSVQTAYFSEPQAQQSSYPTLPANVVNDDWYKQFTGSKPDRSHIQQVFPWETQQHRKADRVFPRGDTPPPQSPPPQSPPSASSRPPLSVSVQQPTPPVAISSLPSPPVQHRSMAEAMASYTNAWDADPAISRYISLITGDKKSKRHGQQSSRDFKQIDYDSLKSVPGTPRIAKTEWLDHARDRQSDISGDGDDEDEGDEASSSDADMGMSPEPVATERDPKLATPIPFAIPDPSSSSPANARYRDRHTQTDRTALHDAKVQAHPSADPSPTMRASRLPVMTAISTSGGSAGDPNGRDRTTRYETPQPSSSSDTARPSPASLLVTPTGTFPSPSSVSPAGFNAGSDKGKVDTKGVTYSGDPGRRTSFGRSQVQSQSSSQNASPSTYRPQLPQESAAQRGGAGYGSGAAVSDPKATRHFDPSTDVDMRKRETQKVLTRFMQAGSFRPAGAGAGAGGAGPGGA